jgi:hypothetical protein
MKLLTIIITCVILSSCAQHVTKISHVEICDSEKCEEFKGTGKIYDRRK